MTPTQSPTLASQVTAELPKLPEPTRMSADQAYLGFTADQMNAHYLAGVEAGRASRAQSEWISVETMLPPQREKAYQIVSIAKKLHGPGNYEGQGIKAVAQDWNVRRWPESYTHWMYLPATLGETK